MRHLRLVPACLALMMVASGASLAQKGKIEGKVSDQNGEPIPYANVLMVGTNWGAASNASGEFVILNAPAGTYTLQVRVIGYRTQSAEVTITEGQTVRQDFTLATDILQMDEVVSTATRMGRPQRETTVSMSVVTETMIRGLQPSSTADVLARIPGVSAEGGGGEVASNVFVRGVPAGGQFRYQTLQVDGMPLRSIGDDGGMSAQDVYFRQDLNVQSLEVVKGGSSSLYGFSAPGGIINYISKTGGEAWSSALKGTVGDKSLFRYDFNTNGPLGEDWRFNLGGFYRYDEGPRVSGFPTQGLQMRGNITRLLNSGYLRLYLTYLDDRVQFFLPIAHHSANREIAIVSDGTHNSAEAGNFSLVTPEGRFQSRMGNGVLTKGTSVIFEYLNNFGEGWSLQNKTRWMDVNHEFEIFIPEVAAFSDAYAQRFMSNPATDQALYTFASTALAFTGQAVHPQGTWTRIRPTEDLGNQFMLQKLLKAGSAEHQLSVGAYLSRTEYGDRIIFTRALFELADQPRLLNLAIRNANGRSSSVTTNGVLEMANNYRNSRLTSNNIAVFGGDEIKLSERFRIDAGIRYERQSGTVLAERITRFDLRSPADSSQALRSVAWGAGAFARRNVQFDDWAASLGANYQMSSSLNLYGVASRSYVFPGLTTFAGNVAVDSQGNFVQPEPEKNETFLQAEGGLKLSASRLAGTLALFWSQILDRLQANLKIWRGGDSGLCPACRAGRSPRIGRHVSTSEIHRFQSVQCRHGRGDESGGQQSHTPGRLHRDRYFDL